MRLLRARATAFPGSLPSLLLGALLSLAVGTALYTVTARTIDSDAQARFEVMARFAQFTIRTRIKSYTDALLGAAGLFRAHPDTNADQFHEYVEQLNLYTQFPGLSEVNYARHIGEAQRETLEQDLRKQFASQRLPDQISVRPVGRRSSYTPVLYAEPQMKFAWSLRLGFDLETAYERELARMRDGNLPMASNSKFPVQKGPNPYGIGLRAPVYRGGMPTASVDERRAAYIGTVGSRIAVRTLVSDILEEMSGKGIRLTVTDLAPLVTLPTSTAKARPATSILYDSQAEAASPAPTPATSNGYFRTSLPVEFHQRRWRVDFSAPKSTWYTPFDTLYPPLAGLAGAFTTTLLYLLFLSQATSRRRAVKLAEVMTLELRASQDELQSTNQRLRRLAAHAEHVKEEERKRIAREIHDDLAQILLSLKIDAEMLTARTCSSHRKLHERAADTLQRIDAGIRSVRHVINDLRPSALDLGLEAAVDWQVAEFERRTGIKCELSKSDGEPTVRDSSAIALFRILQESLNNVARHAHATHVWISLQQQNDTLALTVRDDGIGLRPDSRSRQGSFGLIGMEERVHLLGGNFRIGSDTQGGTAIVVRIPVAPAEPVSHSPDRQLA